MIYCTLSDLPLLNAVVGIGFDFGKANYDNVTGSPAYLSMSVRSVILSNLKNSTTFYHEEGLT